MSEVAGYNVITDPHTRADLLDEALKLPGKPIINGDFIDGPGDEIETFRRVIDLYDSDNPNVLLGNHEPIRLQVIQAALQIKSGNALPQYLDMVRLWTRAMSFGGFALRSYDVEPSKYKSATDRVMELYERMESKGFVSFLLNLQTYYEGDDFISIHAGLTEEPLADQFDELGLYRQRLICGNSFEDTPGQLYSFILARTPKAFRATEKTVITGHIDLDENAQRITADGKRVRLGSQVKYKKGGALFTYNTNSRLVIPVCTN